MRLLKDILSNTYTKPNFYLCETDKTRICKLDTTNTKGSFKFNSYSEISFEVARIYNDLITGKMKVFPYYDKIEALRLIEVENIGYFEIQGPELSSDGIKESKEVTAYSLEYTLSQKYLDDFFTVNGRDEWDGSLEDQWQVKHNNYERVPHIVLYNPTDPDTSVLHLILEKVYGWHIGHVDKSLWTLSREFDIDRESVYDFIMNEICEKFNCYAVFDTIKNEINLYAESLTSKFMGDGETTKFIISPPFGQVNTVSVGGYKTSQWEYDEKTGILSLYEAPKSGELIEVVDGAMQQWETDVFVTFDNLSQEINIDYDAESIKTVLTVSYGDDGDIREVNLGLPYLVDLSYYYNVDWMGQDLYDTYAKYLQKTHSCQADYTAGTKKRLEIAAKIAFEMNRLSLHYSIASIYHGDDISKWTVGTYYERGGEAPNYYYIEVSLPEDYKPNTTYYSMNTANLNETKVNNLYAVFQIYFNRNNNKIYMTKNEETGEWEVNNSGDKSDWETEIDKLVDDFKFMDTPGYTLADLKNGLKNTTQLEEQNTIILNFLNVMWNEVGKTPLQKLYLEPFKKLQTLHMSMDQNEDWDGGNWSNPNHRNYWLYYPVTLMIESIEKVIAERTKLIEGYQAESDKISAELSGIADELLISNNFTKEQQVRLSAFLREDELQLDDIIDTDLDDLNQIYKNKQDAMESGRIELQKLCQPQLQFSMSMANIYALPEFEPIIDQFQLGNVIKVALRPDYIKQSRLLQVDMNFDDLSDFSCEFGDLTNLRTQSDIHADLLKKAVQAGKSVATSGDYWTKGANKATETDIKIEQGLLDANQRICAIDGTQDVVLDKYGLHLQKKNPTTGEIDPKQAWFVNNNLLFTTDGWKTTRMGIGEFEIKTDTGEPQEMYGVVADAVLAGYIEGSHIRGGDIYIGRQDDDTYAFQVENNGDFNFGGKNGVVYNSTNKQMTFGSDVSLTWDQITGTDDIATTGDIPNVSDKLKEYLNSDNIGTYITKDAISTLGLAVGEEILMGPDAKISWDNLPTDIATTGDISDSLQGYLNQDNYSTYITKDWIGTLGLAVGDQIKMGPNATISWSNVANKPNDFSGDSISDCLKGYLNDKNIGTYITNNAIKTLGLTVGNEILMGPDAVIKWENIDGADDVVTIDSLDAVIKDSGFATSDELAELINGYDFASQSDIPTKVSDLTNDSGFINSDKATQITGNYIATHYIVADAVAAENITGTTIKGKTFEGCTGEFSGDVEATSFHVNTEEGIYMSVQNGIYIDATVAEMNPVITMVGIGRKQAEFRMDSIGFNYGWNEWGFMSFDNTGFSFDSTVTVQGNLTAHNVDIGIYALLGGPGSVTIVDPASDKNGEVYFGVNSANSASGTTSYLRGKNVRIYAHGSKGGVYLGSSGFTAITSDENLKNIFDIDDRYESFFNNINPVAYQYKVGHRTHLGFGARAIENALQDANLTTEEFAGILIDRNVSVGEDEIMSPDGATHFDEIYSLRYEEFIALNTYMIKKQQRIIEDLTRRIESIENVSI